MLDLLSWLWSQASKVYAWFGSSFYSFLDAAAHAWDWAVSQASAALSSARSYAYNLYRGITSDISSLFDWSQYQVGRLWDQMNALTAVTYSQVSSWISLALGPVWSAVSGVAAQISGAVGALWDRVMSWVQARVSDAVQLVQGAFSWLLSLRQRLTDLVAQFSPQRLSALVQFIDKQLAQVMQFLQDPVTWLLDVLQGTIISALSWILAWALGAVQSELPGTPPW